MTDIVERLRGPDDGDPFSAGWKACLLEAADEIEWLRAENERMGAAVSAMINKADVVAMYDATAEIKQLRAMLGEIEEMIDGEIDINPHGGPNLAMRVQMAIALWKDRYEAERDDHEATMKHADESR